jgi:hypothetical protein
VFGEVVHSVPNELAYILATHSQIPVIRFALEFAGQDVTHKFAARFKNGPDETAMFVKKCPRVVYVLTTLDKVSFTNLLLSRDSKDRMENNPSDN